MKSNILIRVDGSQQIGLGHLIRCSALGQMLKNDFVITFFCREIPTTIVKELGENGFKCIKITNEDEFFTKITSNNNIVVLDGYHFDTSYQKQIKATGAKLVCIDDLHDKEYFADLIINHSPEIKSSSYKAQPYTQFALGLEYALLRPVFLEQAKKKRDIDKIETLMICFGGSDIRNFTLSTLEVILEFFEFKKIIVVTGLSYQSSKRFEYLVKSNHCINHLHALNQQQILLAMLDAEIAIVPASGVLLEAICCSCNILSFWYTDNQREFHEYLLSNNIITSFGDNSISFKKEELINGLKEIYEKKREEEYDALREKISLSGKNLHSAFLKMANP